MSFHLFEADFLASVAASTNTPAQPPHPQAKTVTEVRENFNYQLGGFGKLLPSVEDKLSRKTHSFKSHDGADIFVYEYHPTEVPDASEPTSALLYLHGGGLVSCEINPHCDPHAANYAVSLGVRLFGVEYRLAPENPYPAGVEDCYASLKWLVDNAQELNIDPKRIGLVSESGGGCLSMALTLMARDRGHSPPIAHQMLIYPMLDDRSQERHFDVSRETDQAMKYMRDGADICWEAYLGEGKRGTDDVSAYASPARARDLSKLPPTYIELGSLDVFRDESLELASRLVKADVDVDLHLYKGMPHGWDFAAPTVPACVNAKENRRRVAQRI